MFKAVAMGVRLRHEKLHKIRTLRIVFDPKNASHRVLPWERKVADSVRPREHDWIDMFNASSEPGTPEVPYNLHEYRLECVAQVSSRFRRTMGRTLSVSESLDDW